MFTSASWTKFPRKHFARQMCQPARPGRGTQLLLKPYWFLKCEEIRPLLCDLLEGTPVAAEVLGDPLPPDVLPTLARIV